MPTGAGAGLVLTSDASGNATWQTAQASTAGWSFGGNTVDVLKTLGTVDNNDFPLITDNLERLRITAGGNVLIGKTSQTNSGYLLDVNGNIRANKIVVNTSSADFVFEPCYRLPSLQQDQTIRDYDQKFKQQEEQTKSMQERITRLEQLIDSSSALSTKHSSK